VFDTARLQFVKEDALLVEFGDTLDDKIFQKVLTLDHALMASDIRESIETLPTYRSLLIHFDVFKLSHDELLKVLSALDLNQPVSNPTHWRVPVCMEGECAEDLGLAASALGCSKSDIIDTLLHESLKLYMYGFSPGLAYLGGLDSRLTIPRRATPRPPMRAGSLMIAAGLACLAPVSMPTGWYVIGQTSVTLFSSQRNPMVPFAVGDELQFYCVSFKRFAKLQKENENLDGLAGVGKVTQDHA
jgi:inhibitor of KinA